MVFFLKEYEEFTEIAHFIKDALQQNRLFVLKKKNSVYALFGKDSALTRHWRWYTSS